jgi:hypothetical protein
MAMIRCRECDKEISSEAETCPQCGCSDPSTGPVTRSAKGVILSALAVVGVLYWVKSHVAWQKESKEDLLKTCY